MNCKDTSVPLGAYTCLPTIRIAGDVTMKPKTNLGPRRLDEYELLYFPDGSNSVYTVGKVSYTLAEPCFIISRPNETHDYQYDPEQPCRHMFIHFHFKGAENNWEPLQQILKDDGPSYIPIGEERFSWMMKQILLIAYSLPERLQQRGSTLLLALLEEINGHVVDKHVLSQAQQLPSQIAKALDYIEKNLHKPISIEQLAQNVGWTHEHFSRFFVQHMGRTPREMIIQQRVEKACQLLLYEDWTVKKVAYSVGFSDENYFCRVFKSIKGMTATNYRKKYFDPRYRDIYPEKETNTLYPHNRILFNGDKDN